MGKATLARQRVIGAIGLAKTQRIDAVGVSLIDTLELDRLKARVAELERENKMLREIATDLAQTGVLAAALASKVGAR